MSGELGDLIEEMKVVQTILVFTAFAVAFSLAKSFLHVPIGVIHAAIPAGLFFIGNAVKYILDDHF